MKELHQFLKENSGSFPNYFRIRELKEHCVKGNLHKIHVSGHMVGFYVVDGTQFKSFYINRDYRKTGLTEKVMELIQSKHPYLTIALNKNSTRMMKFAKKFNFFETSKVVQGKTYKLTIYEYSLKKLLT